jgi:hypothetical protein
MHECHWFSHLGRTIMPSRPPLCSYKWVWKYDLGSSLQSNGRKFWHGKKCGCSTEKFLLFKTSIRREKVYEIFHFPCHFQANHQEERIIHPSSYSREGVGIHIDGLHVWPSVHQERKWLCIFGGWSVFKDGHSHKLQEENHNDIHFQDLLQMSVGPFWDTTNHHLWLEL